MARAGTKGVPRAQREQQILDAACREFARAGYAGMSLAAVAAGADISKPMILAYFGSKEQLYIACLKRASDKVGDQIEAAMGRVPPTLALPQEVFRAIFHALDPRPADWLVIWDQTLPEGGDALAAAKTARSRLVELAGQGVAAIGEAPADRAMQLREREDLAVLTQGWMGMVGAIVNWWIRHPDQTADQMAERAGRALAVVAGAGLSDEWTADAAPATPAPGVRVRGSETGRPLMAAFDLFGRRWAILIVWQLRTEAKSFTQLQEDTDVTPGVLRMRLQELTDARIVRDRNAQYSLTALGRSLLVALAPLELWAKAWSAKR
ncbi:TetR family transcriptional regulator [Mycolicibacter sp. MYC123]|uniref:TetR family transcriptional regulator n=1 Tax=[Mycobacterium] zoologicum TaxID=2872311 RepID=A0ABU5YKC4_9MYCO|nr:MULTISPECIES: TetR family transcriptional regulator [unclassified Mycolicibacter]MEB3050340.1 TetR family transcriptional regulator [Mycolicibacter sp. MYC123]MEB3062744.1 TetR family transcriptional regulator [Mycolicibacter sp. MYC101]